ncbi:MAG: hypothetical protein NTU91_06330, partial [Chloroflexi bacterium]|nr:hypothetical protein [Chloroflexota bacterium]
QPIRALLLSGVHSTPPMADQLQRVSTSKHAMDASEMADILGGQFESLAQIERESVLRILRRQARRSLEDPATELRLCVIDRPKLDQA